ncbi:hypothetical protein [Ruminococcus sp. 5_1_39BFAA]|uniref:hypothetical protein n=1 Tax=Ruminococcus sp. 5_1_39BFAA TaxID=457412 RepID=UPI003569F623
MEAIFNEKKDLNSRQYLRTYMGHKELSTTAYYIHLLPEKFVFGRKKQISRAIPRILIVSIFFTNEYFSKKYSTMV